MTWPWWARWQGGSHIPPGACGPSWPRRGNGSDARSTLCTPRAVWAPPASPALAFAPTPPCKPAAAGLGPACRPSSAGGGGGGGGCGREGLGKEQERDTSGAAARDRTGQEGSAVAATSCLRAPAMPGKQRRGCRAGLEEKRWQSLEERGSGARRGQPVLTRSKTCDPSFCKEPEQAVGHLSPSLSKRVSSYRRAFGQLAEQDVLLGCFSCAWQREVPYHGRLYISSCHICFHSSLLLKDIKVVVPVASVSAMKKTNTALLVPNALSIRTAEGEKFLFVSLHRREATYQLLKSVCKHLQDNDWSPPASPSTKEIRRRSLTSSQSGLEQSTPEPNSLQELPDGPSPTPRPAEEEEVTALVLSSDEQLPLAKPCSLWGTPTTALWARTIAQLSPLNTIILIYLMLMVALLLSSAYIGLRILELEQQLASMGAWPDLTLSQHHKMT
ncbi:GRAM domain-containing protein 2A-like [Apus apus]|uniref:GRAM domain-containing protein 2A-like n=1 Tax=Apus apus TaxID=8895 RepID=UPI0021F87BDF|nr:GRAM domain-containing protein 2A-like [Apus apus]